METSTLSDPAASYRRGIESMHLAWGVAWFVGFLLLFLAKGPGAQPLLDLPAWLPLTVLFVLLAGAGVVTAVVLTRAFGRGGESEFARRGRWYGWAWLISFVGMILTVGTLSRGMTPDQTGLLWGASAVGLTAA